MKKFVYIALLLVAFAFSGCSMMGGDASKSECRKCKACIEKKECMKKDCKCSKCKKRKCAAKKEAGECPAKKKSCGCAKKDGAMAKDGGQCGG